MNIDDLDLETIEFGFGVAFGGYDNMPVFCPWCEDKSSISPSCSVHRSGVFRCHGKCRTKGTVIEFFGQMSGLLPHEAEESLSKRDPKYAVFREKAPPPRPPIERLGDAAVRDMIERAHLRLASATDPNKRDKYYQFREYLREERGLNDRTITIYEIGADEYRLTIPVYWADETPGIRQYLPHAAKGKKIKHNPRAVTATRIYPYRRYEHLVETEPEPDDFVILCEGEWDCLLLNQYGYFALTTTAGVGNWRDEWYDLIIDALRGRPLVLMFDVNDKKDVGQIIAKRRATEFAKRGVQVYNAKLPIEDVGGDVTDWFVKHKNSKGGLDGVIARAMEGTSITPDTFTEIEMEVPADDIEDDDKPVGLIEALQTRTVHQEVTVQALVVAKADAPYRVPSHFRVSWDDGDGEADDRTIKLDKTDPRYLSLVAVETPKQLGLMKAWAGCPTAKKFKTSVEVLEYASIEELYVSPVGQDMKGVEDRQVPPAYSIGLGVAPNTIYRFTGVLAPRPKDQHSTFLFWKGHIDGTDIDTFELGDEDIADMMDAFTTVFDGKIDVGRRIREIAEEHARLRTMVYGRPDLHQLIDLAYHSSLRINYGNEKNIRGRLDVGIFGDTRTGKSQAAERIKDFYGVGSTMLCENKATASGIMGGVNRINGTFVIKPGRIPLAHRRLLICDEMNQLSVYEIGNLTGTRSSGEVHIEKIVHGVFPAEARLIWLSNPREEDLESYCNGIEMVKDLIGDAADIARFDAILIVSAADVKRELIEKSMREKPSGTPRYPVDLCRKLVLWVWSRRVDQIKFTEKAVAEVFDAATRLAKQFHASMPLLLDAESRHKVARLAAAAAGRVFSTNDGESIIVTENHVQYAEEFLVQIYSKPSCGYDEYSAVKFAEEILNKPEDILHLISKQAFPTFAEYVLRTRELSRDGLMIAAGLDHMQIFQFLHVLQRAGAIRSGPRSTFVRTKAFKFWLSEQVEHSARNDNNTPEETA